MYLGSLIGFPKMTRTKSLFCGTLGTTCPCGVPAPSPTPSLLHEVKPPIQAQIWPAGPYLLPPAVEGHQGHERRHLQQEVQDHRKARGQCKGPHGGHGGQGTWGTEVVFRAWRLLTQVQRERGCQHPSVQGPLTPAGGRASQAHPGRSRWPRRRCRVACWAPRCSAPGQCGPPAAPQASAAASAGGGGEQGPGPGPASGAHGLTAIVAQRPAEPGGQADLPHSERPP